MTGSLEGKMALVTGASKGIGAGIAKAFAAAGATVAINYATSRERADAVVAEIAAAGGTAWAVQGNVSIPADVEKVYDEVGRRMGKLDVLVNNAGVYAAMPIEAFTTEHFYRLFGTNVFGLLRSIQAALPLFPPAAGSIVNLGALSSRMASPGISVYAGSKGAVDAITLSLSKELGPRGIRVNALSPGAVETEGLVDSGFLEGPMRARMIASTPAGRLGQPADIANAAVFLASDASSWINGQIICAAGGLTY